MKTISYIIAAVLLFAISYTNAQTNITLHPSHDVTITSSIIGSSKNSESFSCGFTKRTVPGGKIIVSETRSIIKFDLSSIPQDAIILNAKLTLYGVNHVNTIGSYLQPIISNWSDSTLTWANQPQAVDEGSAYFEPTVDPFANYEIDMSFFVDTWVKGAHNYGLLFRQGEGFISGRSYFNFASSDYPDSSMIPKLEITYITPIKMNYTLVAGTVQGTNDIIINITGGVPPYSLAWNTGETTSNLTDVQSGIYTLSVIDAIGAEGFFQVNIQDHYPVTWTDLNNTIVEGNKLISVTSTDTSNTTYGATSLNKIEANTDGSIRYIVDSTSGNRSFSLRETNIDTISSGTEYKISLNYMLTGILWAFRPPQKPSVSISVSVAVGFPVISFPINIGDVYEITRTGNKIYWIINNQIRKDVPIDPNKQLIADASFYSPNAQLKGVEMTVPTSGATCALAQLLPPLINSLTETQLQLSDTVFWTKFTANSSSMIIEITNPDQIPIANIKRLLLYSGTCENLQLITQKDKDNGEQLKIFKDNLVIGNTYYISTEQDLPTTGWFRIRTSRPLEANAGDDKIIVKGKNITIGGNPTANFGTPPYTYNWSPALNLNDPAISNPIANPTQNTVYTVEITDADGNTASNNMLVRVEVPIEIETVVHSTVDSTTVAFDRFGRTYKAEDLQKKQAKDVQCSPSFGNLTFDLDFTPAFMSHPAHVNMMDVICRVFHDLACLVQPPSPVTVNILIGYSVTMPADALAGATTFYHLNPQSNTTGIIDGDVWKAINTGLNDPSVNDGQIMVNLNFAWHYLDVNSPAYENGLFLGFYDAYSVILHEAYHLLGFNSLIGSLGQSLAPAPFDHYSRFDQYLQSNDAGNLGNFINWDGCYDAQFGLNTSAIYAGNPPDCFIVYDGPTNSDQQPVYAPGPDYEQGSTLSHFNNACAPPSTNYLMHPNIPENFEHRWPTPEEVQVLCDIGYNVTGVFGFDDSYIHHTYDACSNIVAGVNDGVWTIDNCAGSTIEISATSTYNPIANDINTASIECLTISSGSGSLAGNIYTPDVNTVGFVTLTYIPVNDQGIRGNITSIRIFVTPCGGTECNNNDLCNMICNFNFQIVDPCVITNYVTIPPNPMHICHYDPFDVYGETYVDAWYPAFGSPQWYMEGVEPGLQDGYAAMWSNTPNQGEGIYTFVNIEVGHKYIFSYYRKASWLIPFVATLDNVYVKLGFSAAPNSAAEMTNLAGSFTVLRETNIMTPDVPENWKQVVVCFTADANYNQLFIYPQQNNGSVAAWLNVDRVELIEDNFPTTDATIDIVNCVVDYNLPQLCSVDNISYQWSADYDVDGTYETPINNPSSPTDPFNPNPSYPLYDAPIGQNVLYEYIRNFPTNPSTVVFPVGQGCSITPHFVNAIQTNPMIVTVSHTDITPCNAHNGTASVVVTGGTPPYTYQWQWGDPVITSTDQNIVNLDEGDYSLTVQDANGCQAFSGIVHIDDNLAPEVTITGTNIACFGDINGAAEAIVTSGTSPYSYLWNTGATTSIIYNLTPNYYSVTVTDANGCIDEANINIQQFLPLIVSSAQTIVTCYGGPDNGQASVTVSGGNPPYTYLWSDGATEAINYGLAIGTYTVTVTDNANCSTSIDIVIDQSPPLVITTASSDVLCHGGGDGTATVTSVTGGMPPYTYHWNTTPTVTTATADNLIAGIYIVTVIDAYACEITANVTVSEPPETPLELDFIVTNNICNGGTLGSAIVIVNGGSENYSYEWNTVPETVPISYIETAVGLAAGTYFVSVFDINGLICEAASVTITEPAVLSVQIAPDNISCFGADDGEATATVSGGTTPYSYLWDNGQTTANISPLIPGVYQVTVNDANNCGPLTESVTITEPALLTVSVVGTDVNTCSGGNNGTVNTTVSGGITPYTFLWSDGSITQNLTTLIAGTYSVTVTDANACQAFGSVDILEPTSLTVNFSFTDVSCHGGNNGIATANPSGSTAPYTYLWSNGNSTQSINNLIAGTYTVTVTDNHNCTVIGSVLISEPPQGPILCTLSTTNVTCYGFNDGIATVTASGGTGNYTYNWNTIPVQYSQTANNLAPGTYYVTVSDGVDCSAEITVPITQPNQLGTGIIKTDVQTCYGDLTGSINLIVVEGTLPYTYLWNNGATTQDISGLGVGQYIVTVTDANGCYKIRTVNIFQPPQLTATLTGTNASCNDGNNSAANLTEFYD